MKKLARKLVAAVLYWQVRRLRRKNNFQVIAVEGSIGKTSTKMAIARLLSAKLKVRYQEGNYNDLVTVPLVFFGHPLTHLFNPISWLRIFISNELQLLKKCQFDVVVLEIGTDGPGFIEDFAKRLRTIDINVLTGIAPEHMEYFDDLDAVAEEEKKLTPISTLNLINVDMCAEKYTAGIPNTLSYSINKDADYQLKNLSYDDSGCSFDIFAGSKKIFSGQHEAISEPLLYAILAAIAVGVKMGLNSDEIEKGLATIKPASGRMQLLDGVKKSRIIDDTYNASPEAVMAALKTLYRLKAPQKIAILGNMNELGKFSEEAHKDIGDLCDPAQLDYVITIGPDANTFLAEGAKEKGCKVKTFNNPYEAGDFVKSVLEQSGLVLAKGSQNGVFAEEAIKSLLANTSDESKLVRQSRYWLKIKQKAFN